MKALRRSVLLVVCATCSSLLFAGGQGETPPNSGPQSTSTRISCFVSIPPEIYFVKEIGGDRIDVQSLVPPGVEPESYDPTPRQMAMLSRARLYFAVGLPFEKVLIPKIRNTMKGIAVVATQAGVPLRSFEQPTAGSQEAGADPHIWLAPELVKIQGAAIEKALVSVDPAGARIYADGLKRLDGKMDQLHRLIASSLAGFEGRSFFVFHPAFGYFADEFGLKQVSIEVEGKSPGPKQLAEIISEAKRLGAKTIFVEPQFDQSRAQVVADSIGARVVTIDPLAENYPENLTAIAKSIKAAIE